jgi:hypothetical protein
MHTITPRVMHALHIDRHAVETGRFALVSTGHMSQQDNAALLAAEAPDGFPEGYYGRTRAGWIFLAPWHPDDQPDPAYWQDRGFSNELAENIRALSRAGFYRIEFDADAPRVPGLHWFNW